MNRLIFITGFLLLTSVLFAQTPLHGDPHWELEWKDDFNYFNGNIWWMPQGVQDGELSVSTSRDTNVFISNGNLVLQALEEEYWFNGKKYDYTSGKVSTGGNHNVRYGYMEARMKLPYGQGLHSSFWTWNGGDHTNVNAGEIDIFEMVGYKPSTTMGTNLHMYYCPDTNICESVCEELYEQCCPEPECDPRVLNYQMDIDISSYYNTYHTYAVEWDPAKIIWYVDGVSVRNFPNPGIVDYVRILLNLSLDSWDPNRPDSTTPLPSQMYIDSVRVFKLKFDCYRVVTHIPNFDTHDYKVKKNIRLGSNTVIPAGKDITLRATDYIELQAGFEVPANAGLYLDINPCEDSNIWIEEPEYPPYTKEGE